MGFGRVHGAGNNSTRSELRRWLLRSGVGHRTARRLSRSEPTIRSCGKTLERGRPGSSRTAQRSPKTRLEPDRASYDPAAIAETPTRPRWDAGFTTYGHDP